MDVDRAGLRVLTRQECLTLLASTHLGRIGISWQALPMIFPVHFALAGDRVLVVTWDGSVVSKATNGTVVAFEADHGNDDGCGAWSVLVNGVAEHVDEQPSELADTPWVPDRLARFVSISTDQMTGRRAPDHDSGRSALLIGHRQT